MFFVRDTLDDLLRDVFGALLSENELVRASRGSFKESLGCCLRLRNPRARLSRSEGKGKIFSALGELLWYLSGDTRLDFIDYYIPNRFQRESDDQLRVRSGYGARLFSFREVNQIENVIKLLTERPTSRRAVIQLFDATDLTESFASIPCTCTLQFLRRDAHLHLCVAMRSNDAYIGLPHDVFAFTMLQELIARSIHAEIGEYTHFAGSLHMYESDFAAAEQYLDEGWQASIAMPPMPEGDPWPSVAEVQRVEESIRSRGNGDGDVEQMAAGDYWKDLGRLLRAWRATRDKDVQILVDLMSSVSSDDFKMFLQARIDNLMSQGPMNAAARNPQ